MVQPNSWATVLGRGLPGLWSGANRAPAHSGTSAAPLFPRINTADSGDNFAARPSAPDTGFSRTRFARAFTRNRGGLLPGPALPVSAPLRALGQPHCTALARAGGPSIPRTRVSRARVLDGSGGGGRPPDRVRWARIFAHLQTTAVRASVASASRRTVPDCHPVLARYHARGPDHRPGLLRDGVLLPLGSSRHRPDHSSLPASVPHSGWPRSLSAPPARSAVV